MIPYARLTPGPGWHPLRASLYYAQRLVPWKHSRRAISARIASSIAREQKRDPGPPPRTILDSLTRDGLVLLPALLSHSAIQEIVDHVAEQPLELRDGTHVLASAVGPGVPLGDYPLSVVVNAPHVLELANDPLLIRLATAYIGCAPTISSIGLRWSFPAPLHASNVQSFHRDPDDWRFFKFFAYLTDVDADAGPHVFVRSSHNESGQLFARPYRERDVMQRYGSEQVITVSGARGTMFVADTHGIHKGAVPTRAPRLLFEVGYSLLPIYAFNYAPERLTRAHPMIDPYINRLIVAA